MPINQLTHDALSHLNLLQDDEHIIDMAPARCRELDEQNMAILERAAGGTAGVRLWAKCRGLSAFSLLEADLVVTTRALYYVAYHPRIATIAEWEVLCGVETAKPKRFSATGPLTVVYRTGRRREFEVSRGAVEPFTRHVQQHLS